jgi:hypothetical protein
MMMSQDPIERDARMLGAWHLAILRFAVTRDDTDRLNVIAIAGEIDRLGRERKEGTGFAFFRKTAASVCAAVLGSAETAGSTLQQYLARIDDARLKRAMAAACAVELSEPTAVGRRPKPAIDLWNGLASRDSTAH